MYVELSLTLLYFPPYHDAASNQTKSLCFLYFLFPFSFCRYYSMLSFGTSIVLLVGIDIYEDRWLDKIN